MTFLNENRVFKDAMSFAIYLTGFAKPTWPIGSTYHNTYVPDISDWHGSASMIGMQSFYEGKGWDRGPHCYVAVGAPDSNNDGIWVMTRPDLMGIHAGDCNLIRWGIEVVGDFQNNPPNAGQLGLLADAISTLHRWVGLGPDVNAHRDCMPGRTCPGDAFYAIKDTVIKMVADRTSNADIIWDQWGVVYPLDKSARGFGIPRAWYENMNGPADRRLGAAESYPVYDGSTVFQAFEHGVILYRNGATRIILYKEFRVP